MTQTRIEHRVATHLGVDATAYDVQIRRWVPGYEEMIATVVSILDETLPAEPRVIDLGAGTGALAGAILAAIPRARVQLVDIDPAMLEGASARLAAFGPRAELRRASFADALPPCDAVVASLALHHVPELDRKRALYSRIHAALRPGGVLLSADATVHEDGPEHARFYREWAARMATAGISATEAKALFAQWAGEDRYYPLTTELALLADAGFPRPECFWKQGASTVFGGFRA
jgi:tRNA (cmo5U34)-methyltransferase